MPEIHVIPNAVRNPTLSLVVLSTAKYLPSWQTVATLNTVRSLPSATLRTGRCCASRDDTEKVCLGMTCVGVAFLGLLVILTSGYHLELDFMSLYVVASVIAL